MITQAALIIITVLSVHDGDTLKTNLPCDLPWWCNSVDVRLFGIDTPEINDKRPELKEIALQAKSRLKELTSPPHKVALQFKKPDKFGKRLDGIVYSDGQSIPDILISEGLARPYFGKGKKPW